MPVLPNFSLRELAYYQTGGRCQALYAPTSLEELCDFRAQLAREGTPYFLLGAGTNSLVMDEPWPGAVLSFHQLTELRLDGTGLLYGEAGVLNSQLAQVALTHHLTGAAWMYRLPGQLGATVRMNARCYGGEISQVVSKVWAVTRQGELKTYDNSPSSQRLFKGYKETVFMGNDEVIAAAQLRLQSGDDKVIAAQMQACANDRLAKKQFIHPTCGCVFKNDYSPEVSVSSGLLLELAGVKGMAVGGAEVSPYHANFIYNKGATSSDILRLSLLMREAVWTTFGVWLAYEMELLGHIPSSLISQVQEHRPPQYQSSKLNAARQEFQQRQTP